MMEIKRELRLLKNMIEQGDVATYKLTDQVDHIIRLCDEEEEKEDD